MAREMHSKYSCVIISEIMISRNLQIALVSSFKAWNSKFLENYEIFCVSWKRPDKLYYHFISTTWIINVKGPVVIKLKACGHGILIMDLKLRILNCLHQLKGTAQCNTWMRNYSPKYISCYMSWSWNSKIIEIYENVHHLMILDLWISLKSVLGMSSHLNHLL